MGKYDTILFGESGTEKPQFKSKYDNILFGDTTQPAEVPAGEVVSETQEKTEDPLAGLPQQEASKDYKSYLGDYGVSADYGNNITYSDLNKRMEADKVDTNVRREIQQEWFKGYQKYIDRLPEGEEKKAHQEHLKELSELPTTYLENTVGNALAEGAKRGIVGTEAVAEGAKNLATSYVDLSDEELLAKYDPALLEQIKKAGGVDHLRQIGMATKLQDEDLSGMGTTALQGATQEQRELGTKMLNALSDARARDTLARTDKEGEEVVMDDGRVVKMSNLQAADYYNKARSRIAGEDEAAKEFNEDVLKSLSTANGWKHLLNAGARSSAQNVPTLLAGTAVSFVAPPVGIAIMQTGNISDQQLQGIQDLADKEYKKQHGEDAEVTSLSSAEYLNFLDKLAEEGKVSEQAADSFKTGFAMTLAEQVTGGVVGKLGSALSGMTAKTLAGKLAATSGAVGIHLTDEGWQEVASQVVENVRNDKPWNEGLAQAFTQGVFSIEGVLQQGAKGVGKLKELKGKDKEAVEKATEQNLAETAEQVADTKAEETPAEQTEPQVEKPEAQAEPTADDINAQLEESREQQEPDFDPLHTRESLMSEYDAITRAIGNGEPTPEQSQRLADIESEFTTQAKNDKGQTVTRNEFAKAYREWQTGTGEFATTQDTVNESRTDNRDGSQDVNGQPVEQGAVVSDTSTTEHSGQTSETVSPVETETTTTGHSESNTGTTANPVEQPNNNTPESDPVGLDGRTGETVGGRREQGELGQDGSQQGNQPSQATSTGSTDSGVRERAKSDSVGETLNEIEGKQYRRTAVTKPTESTVKAKVFRGGNVKGRGVVWNSTNEAVAHLYKAKKGDAVTEADVELKTPRVVDVKGGLYSQVKFDQAHPKNAVAKKYPALYEEVAKMMYGDVKGMPNLFKASDRLVFDTLVNNALVNAGVIKGKVHDGVVMENVIDPSGKSGEFKSAKNEQLLGDNVVTFNQKEFLTKTKDILAPQKPSVADSKVEKENAKRRAIEEAVASEKERIEPESRFTKEFKGNDLRTNQRKAYELLKGADEKMQEEIREAFFKN